MKETKMLRFAKVLSATVLGVASITAASGASTVITSGSFSAGDYLSMYLLPAPVYQAGTYLFTIDYSTPSVTDYSGLLSIVTSGIAEDFHDGNGFQVTQIDDQPEGYSFTQVSPTRWQATMSTSMYDSTSFSYAAPGSGGPDYKFFSYGDCCYVDLEADAGADGTYQITVTPVAEPQTWALMMLGFGVAGAALRTAQARSRLRLSYT